MASLNKVFLLGNLTRDPDLRSLSSGQNVCELRLAVSRRFSAGNGQEQREETCFVDVVVWGRSAANCKQYLGKGSPVLVEGRLQLDQWEDRNGGGTRSRLRVVAEQVQFVGRRQQENGEGGGSYSYDQQPPRQQGGYRNSYGGGNAPAGGGFGGGNAADMPPMPEAGTDAPADDIPF